MAELRFYHLTERPLEAVLPVMLEKSLERGWRAVVRGTDRDRLAALDAHLWTWRDEGFLPHGLEGTAGEDGTDQPVWLTAGDAVPNGANTLFLVDGAPFDADRVAGFETAAVLFDGHDPAAVERARGDWRTAVAAGLKAVYWAQGPDGRWIRKAESGAPKDGRPPEGE